MDLNNIPLFTLLQNKLGYLGERERMIAQNVANASTPGFTPQDLKPFSEQPGIKSGPSIAPVAPVAIATADSSQITIESQSGPAGARSYASAAAPDSETTLDGNQVVIEEQMIKMSDARSDYDTAIGFYQKALAMLHMAVQKPGG